MNAEARTIDISLDSSLQLWVLFPISIATLLMGLLRRNLAVLGAQKPRVDLAKVRDAAQLKRSSLLRMNSAALPVEQFQARQQYMAGPGGVLHLPKTERSPMSALMNPESLATQITSIMLNLLPHMLLGTWARYMFAGVAVCKLPFTLTPRFRPMLQSGMELAGQNLDVSYVSALSWYLLNMFGNAGLLSLIAKSTVDDHVFMPSAASQMALTMSPEKVYAQERDSLMKLRHKPEASLAEEKFLAIDANMFAAF